jgi:hypothetical protein
MDYKLNEPLEYWRNKNHAQWVCERERERKWQSLAAGAVDLVGVGTKLEGGKKQTGWRQKKKRKEKGKAGREKGRGPGPLFWRAFNFMAFGAKFSPSYYGLLLQS